MAHSARNFKSAPKKNIPIEMTLEKARALTAAHMGSTPRVSQEHLAQANKPTEAPSVLVDAVSLGGPVDGKSKPIVRTVLVKDLHKIGTRLGAKFPRAGVFKEQAPIGLYALFDGQSCAGEPGPMAAEFCARNFHTLLLQHLSALPDTADTNTVTGALGKVFKDLDEQILNDHPEIQDGCGAAVILLIGEHIFAAVLGQCGAVLCQIEDGTSKPWCFGHERTGVLDCDVRNLKQSAPTVVVEDSAGLGIRHPNGKLSRVSRSLGDRSWKQSPDVEQPLVFSTPAVKSFALRGAEHPFVLLVASPVLTGMRPEELIDTAKEFPMQPRAACGEITTHALRTCMATLGERAQCSVISACFLPMDRRRSQAGLEQQPPAKKAKLAGSAPQSMRLRHILLSYSDTPDLAKEAGAKDASAKGSKVKHTRQEAEAMLRRDISDLRKEIQMLKSVKDATEVILKTTTKFTALCREHSECETARKGGNMCGELGWMTPEDRGLYGAGFKDVIDVLLPGELSDIAVSKFGLHLVQRMA